MECDAYNNIIEVKRNGAHEIVDNGHFSRSTLVPPIKRKNDKKSCFINDSRP